MERWNSGMMVKEHGIMIQDKFSLWGVPNIPPFQHSSIPLFHIDPIGG
jgi:hypothetical protein